MHVLNAPGTIIMRHSIGEVGHKSTLPAEYRVTRAEVGSDDLFSRHPGRGAMLYVTRHVYAALSVEQLNGITPNEIVQYDPQT